MPAPQVQPPRSQPPKPSKSTFLDKAAYIAAPGTVVIGLLYYFGSVYTKAYYSTLGVLPEDLGFSFQGILANSPSASFFPVWVLLVGGLVVLLLLGWVGHLLAMPAHATRRPTVIYGMLAVGLVMVLMGFPVFFSDRLPIPLPEGWPRQLVPSLVVALGATLAFFAVQLRLGQGRGSRNRQARTGDRLWLAGGALFVGMLTMSLFFDMARYVAAAGQGNAVTEAEAGYRESPEVVIHSRMRLYYNAPLITLVDRGSQSGPYRYQYSGFRILAKAPSRYYLVSSASRYKDRIVVVLPDNDSLWMEIRSSRVDVG